MNKKTTQLIYLSSIVIYFICNYILQDIITIMILQQVLQQLLLYIAFMVTPYEHIFAKIFLLLISLTNLFNMFVYFITSYFSKPTVIYICHQLHITMFIILVLYGIILYVNAKTIPKSNEYNGNDSYLVRRQAKDFTGLILAFITAPWGYYSIVHKGRQYMYKKGRLISRDFIMHDVYHLSKIDNIDLKKLDNLLGQKWTLKSNCYSTFKSFWI